VKRILRFIVILAVAVLVIIQLFSFTHSNPPVTREIHWNAPETRALAQRACFDCHSNQTVWPWYSYVAPISLRVQLYVNEGREHLNFSAWDQPNADAEEIAKMIRNGDMPLWDYLPLHPQAKLSTAEQEALIAGLEATLANDPPIERRRPGGRE
jgi:cytochrome c551/c552